MWLFVKIIRSASTTHTHANLTSVESHILQGRSFGPAHDKTYKNGMCAQRRLRSAWASAQSDQSLCCPQEESLGT